MRNFTLTGLLAAFMLLLSPVLSAQQYFELGIQGGDMPYNGDFSDTGIGFIKDLNAFGGIYVRYRPVSRFGVRLNGIFGTIAAEQTRNFTNEAGASIPIERSFRSKIQEIGIAAEVDLFYLGDPEDRFFAPYIMFGVGRTSFNPQSQRDGVYYDLQPLRTEAQGTPGGYYDPAPYSLSFTSLHLGGGIRAKLGERIVVGGEISGRVTGTDYLDDVSGLRVNYQEVINNPTGSTNPTLTGFFSNPAVDITEVGEGVSYARGGASDDFYYLINLTVGIRLGGGGRGGSGCYSF